MKNILVLGCGSKSGSWKIRGEQLGAAIGATVVHEVTRGVLTNVGAVVVVKRPHADAVDRLHALGVPVIWDVVDAWPQPIGNWWPRESCIDWLRREVARIRPTAIVATTKAMEADCARFGVPTLFLPHHARPELSFTAPRKKIRTVGYEGATQYLGPWDAAMRKICADRGWIFTTNPPTVAALDVVVAVRDVNGYAARHWKSNVKLANAQAAGLPCVLNREQGYLEMACGAELWADTVAEMEAALDTLKKDNGARLERCTRLHAAAPRLPQVAKTYREWLDAL